MDNKNNKQKTPRFSFSSIIVVAIAALFVGAIIFSTKGCQSNATEIEYGTAMSMLDDSSVIANIQKIEIHPAKDSAVNGSDTIYIFYVDGTASVFAAKDSSSTAFIEKAVDAGILKITYVPGSTFSIWTLLFYVAMGGGVILLFVLLLKRAGGGAGGGMSQTFDFTKSRATLSKNVKTTFKDVAGLKEEKEELQEIVDFLKNPKKYTDMGARVPKGVLLYGKPGTGKTLLARAVAGEAGVPFFYTTGSDLVEMFVGVGASRVRDMFKTAKKAAPSILFMDEIDAIGRQRGTGLGGGNDEREQTLNQLLVELDGFGQETNVIVIAATNRADILDPALLRPGRFDRQIDVSAPDIKGREEILKVHARNKKVASDVDYKKIASQTPGFTGADLENVMNESALLAARENKKEITDSLIGEAIDRVMMGPAKKSRVISDKEKEIVSFHEAGHCIVGTILSNADEVKKVTIIPRGQAGGYNLMGPKDEETYLYTKEQLLERITGLLAGRTAEEIVFYQVTTGASSDMQKATAIAREMVMKYGMSDLGLVSYSSNDEYVFLGRDYASGKNVSDNVANAIDEEVRKIVDSCHENCKKILNDNLMSLKNIAHYLRVEETLYKKDIDEIMSTGHLVRSDGEQSQESQPQA